MITIKSTKFVTIYKFIYLMNNYKDFLYSSYCIFFKKIHYYNFIFEESLFSYPIVNIISMLSLNVE